MKKEEKRKYYLAYGSNLNIEQMLYRCPNAELVGRALLTDYRLEYRGSTGNAHLTAEPYKGFNVPLGVWAVDADDEYSLDLYEGYPKYYRKATVTGVDVFELDSKEKIAENLECFIYLMNGRDFNMPSSRYVQTCRQGYKDFHFGPGPLDLALELSAEELSGIRKDLKQIY